MNFILIAVLVLGAIALIAALVLFGVSKKFAVEEDPRLGQVGEYSRSSSSHSSPY